MSDTLQAFLKDVRPRMLRHLEEEILPFWLLPSMLGSPVGNFPTFASQDGVPDTTKTRYVRMHGRQTFAYLAAYHMLKRNDLLEYGLAGLKKLESYENPKGGYYKEATFDGELLQSPVTIQDQCYSVFPLVMAYRVTKDRKYMEKLWKFAEFIDKGPYLRADGSYCDSLLPDLVTEAKFETPTMNIVSPVDFLNAVLIPLLRATPVAEITEDRKQMLIKWVDLLVRDFWGKGIFWNEKLNRTDWQFKHVDLGHTSKSYGIVLAANRLLTEWGLPERHQEIVAYYPNIAKAASAPHVGWYTDFDVSATTFRPMGLQWWRHVLINQTVFHYTSKYPELLPLLENGVQAWFDCEYVDKTRACRGVRECLDSEGRIISNDTKLTNKANLWKSAYHEVEHVLTFVEGEV